MLALRPTMPGKRFKPSGRNVSSAERHTVKLEIRCPPELASSVRELCAARGLTMAQVLAAGLADLADAQAEAHDSSSPSE